jgi:hypothetical protein
MDTNLLAALVMSMNVGHRSMDAARFCRPSILDGNRIHRERAPRGSALADERKAAAQAKRDRKLKRLSNVEPLKP